MRTLAISLLLTLLPLALCGQTNPEVQEMEARRSRIERQLAESAQLLSSARKDTEGQLSQLSALTARIKQQRKYVNQLNADVKAINKELSSLQEQLTTLQHSLDRRREHYARALQLMTGKNTFENRLMFLLSAESFNQMLRRTRYLREYSNFQKEQGIALMEQQRELDAKRTELEATRKAKQELLAKRIEEQNELNRQEADQKKLVASLRKKEKDIRKQITAQQQERDRLNAEINRIIEAQLAAERSKAKQNGKQEKDADSAMPAYRQNETDRKLSGSFASNKGRLPVPLTGPYLIVSHYGINYVEGLKNVKYQNHGIDLRGTPNSNARAIFGGTVSAVFQFPQGSSSYVVMVRHGEYISAYFNLTGITVDQGDKVKIHEPLGRIRPDASGNCTMQFHLRKGMQPLNPEEWIDW